MERLLNLEFTTICYANCVMCPRNVVKEQGYIDEKTIDNVLEFAYQEEESQHYIQIQTVY